jgi:hypothetical protein
MAVVAIERNAPGRFGFADIPLTKPQCGVNHRRAGVLRDLAKLVVDKGAVLAMFGQGQVSMYYRWCPYQAIGNLTVGICVGTIRICQNNVNAFVFINPCLDAGFDLQENPGILLGAQIQGGATAVTDAIIIASIYGMDP